VCLSFIIIRLYSYRRSSDQLTVIIVATIQEVNALFTAVLCSDCCFFPLFLLETRLQLAHHAYDRSSNFLNAGFYCFIFWLLFMFSSFFFFCGF